MHLRPLLAFTLVSALAGDAAATDPSSYSVSTPAMSKAAIDLLKNVYDVRGAFSIAYVGSGSVVGRIGKGKVDLTLKGGVIVDLFERRLIGEYGDAAGAHLRYGPPQTLEPGNATKGFPILLDGTFDGRVASLTKRTQEKTGSVLVEFLDPPRPAGRCYWSHVKLTIDGEVKTDASDPKSGLYLCPTDPARMHAANAPLAR